MNVQDSQSELSVGLDTNQTDFEVLYVRNTLHGYLT